MKKDAIKNGALISYLLIFINMAAGLLYTPWMVRQIGISDYGLYSLTGVFLSYFMLDFGLGSAIARFIAKYRAENRTDMIDKLLGITIRIYFLISAGIAVALTVIYLFLSGIFQELTPVELETFRVIYVIAGFFSIFSFPFMPVNGVMIAYERFVPLKLFDLAGKILLVSLMVTALFCGGGLYILIWVNGLVGFGIAFGKYLYLKRTGLFKIDFCFFDKTLAGELFRFSFWVFVIGIAQRLLLNIVPTLLGIFSGTTQIAVFSLAMTLEGYTWTFANALNGLFIPKVSQMVTLDDDRSQITDLMIRVGRIQLLVVGLIITGLVILGKPFVTLWMGEQFIDSYYVALFLILPGCITLTQEIAYTLLFVTNELKYRALLFISASLMSVAIGCLLAPSCGAIGTAIGVCCALLVCHVIGMNLIYARVLHLDIGRFFRMCHLKMGFPILLVGLFCWTALSYYPVESWFGFLVSGIGYVALFVVVAWFFMMNAFEKQQVKSLITRLI